MSGYIKRRHFSSYRLGSVLIGLSVLLTACDSSDHSPTDAGLDIGAATAAQHIAIRVEAENFTDGDERWYVTDADNIPQVEPDPDPVHFSTAGGNSYMELLPDTRVTHDDPLNGGENYWGDSNGGPDLRYKIDIPEAGRYLVYTKAYSTGTEDNGIHVGLNDTKPASGKRIQFCAGKNQWTWSSAQRVDENHCGVKRTIYLDIPTAGTHEIVYYAREDGFEIDQFILLKEPEDGSQECAPFGFGHKIQCKDSTSGEVLGMYDLPVTATHDGNVTTAPNASTGAEVDLDIDIDVNNDSVSIGDEVNYVVEITNNDNAEPATSVEVEIALPDGLSFIASDTCNADGSEVKCTFNQIDALDSATASFLATAGTEGTHRVDAQVTADQSDVRMGNNAASVAIDAAPAIPAYGASLGVIHGTNTIGLNEFSRHLLLIKNTGLEQITDARLVFTSNALVTTIDEGTCNANTCDLSAISSGDTNTVTLTVSGTTPGHDTLMVTLLVSGDGDAGDNEIVVPLRITAPQIITSENGDIALEAEDFSSQTNIGDVVEGAYNSAWFAYTSAIQPSLTPDFDATAPDSASGSAYVELLPDVRTGPDDPPLIGVSNFITGEQSPTLDFDVFFNEAADYTVHARIRSNNEQDASIHVALNNQWVTSASTISVCNPNGDWAWSHQSVDNDQCATGTVATISVSEPGIHTLSVAAATDGVELDKIVLRNANNQPPVDMGPEPVSFSPAPIDLEITSTANSSVYQIEVMNPDPAETAVGIRVSIEGVAAQAVTDFTGFDQCTQTNGVLNCDFNFIEANSSRIAELPVTGEEQTITASLIQASDPNAQNNTTTANVSGGGSAGMGALLALALVSVSRVRRRYPLQNEYR